MAGETRLLGCLLSISCIAVVMEGNNNAFNTCQTVIDRPRRQDPSWRSLAQHSWPLLDLKNERSHQTNVKMAGVFTEHHRFRGAIDCTRQVR